MLPGKTTPLAAVLASVLLLAACAPAAAPSPTAAPPKPAPTAAPAAKPTEPLAAKPAPTAAPAATSAPAAKPAPTAAPAAKPAAGLSLTDAEKAEAEAFYKGKTVRIIVGFAPGGGYDLFARTTAKYLGKYMPGNPNAIVENMVGASSLTLVNQLYNNALPGDGTVVGNFDPALVFVQAVGGGGGAIQFDPAKLPWIGSPTVSTNQCTVTTSSGGDSMEKLIASQKEIVFGSTALGNSTSIQPAMMQHYLGAKVKIVTGYDGLNTVKLAVERGEADGMCGTWESFRSTHVDWFGSNPPFARVVVKGKNDPFSELKDVPLMSQFLKTDEARQILDMAMASQAAGFVYATAPATPPARLKALRMAFVQAWNDREFKADTEKAKLAPIPQDYQTIEKLFEGILTAPQERLQKAKEVLGVK
ncbi:MAG: hypothetical protein HY690_12580 [Chloroflexi bacterium]|nr:hypothetical protein [Chloroflexota bacterium]